MGLESRISGLFSPGSSVDLLYDYFRNFLLGVLNSSTWIGFRESMNTKKFYSKYWVLLCLPRERELYSIEFLPDCQRSSWHKLISAIDDSLRVSFSSDILLIWSWVSGQCCFLVTGFFSVALCQHCGKHFIYLYN